MLTTADVVSCFDSRRLELILFPTERCNFRCTYCYEDFAAGRMAESVVNGVKNLISRRAATLRRLEISWFGGEPLMALPVIEEVSRHVQDMRGANPELECFGSMTTNGYKLNSATFRHLIALGVSAYQISLDGPEAVHNCSRLQLDGSGSFSVIWSNLLAMRNSGASFNVLLRVHVTPETLAAIPELIGQIAAAFAGDCRFSIWFKQVGRLGSPNDGEISIFEDKSEWKTALAELSEKVLASGLKYTEPTSEDYICYAAKPNSLVIRSDGSVGKCTVALSDDKNKIGTLQEDGTLNVDPVKLRLWLRGFSNLSSEDLSCPMRGMQNILGQDALPMRRTHLPVIQPGQ